MEEAGCCSRSGQDRRGGGLQGGDLEGVRRCSSATTRTLEGLRLEFHAGGHAGESWGDQGGVVRLPPIGTKGDRMLLTVKEVAGLLGMKTTTLYAWATQGRIPCVKLNGLVRFPKDEIQLWVEASRKQIPGPRPRLPRASSRGDLKAYIARLRTDGHNSDHGETRPKSGLIGKEEADGAV